MQLVIQGKNLNICEQIRHDISRKARAILSRTGKNIRKVNIHFSDVKNHENGNNKQCAVQLILFGLPSISVVAKKENIQHALAKALQSARHKLIGKFSSPS